MGLVKSQKCQIGWFPSELQRQTHIKQRHQTNEHHQIAVFVHALVMKFWLSGKGFIITFSNLQNNVAPNFELVVGFETSKLSK